MKPDDILRIARAVEPDTRWVAYRDRVRNWHDMTNVDGAIREIEIFDPLNSNDDAFLVLAFLLKWRGKGRRFIELSPWHIGEYYFTDEDQDERITAWTIPHDGTEAGLRRAIVEAAMRVTEAV